MTQKLITRNSDNHRIDFGLAVEYSAKGVRAVGRADNPDYVGGWSSTVLTSADVTITNVADNYAFPSAAFTPEPPLDSSAQRLAMVRGRAAALDKAGKYLEASALRATIGE